MKIQRLFSLTFVFAMVVVLGAVFFYSHSVFAATAQDIVSKAKELAWPYGTSSNTFENQPTDAFVQATGRVNSELNNDNCLSFVKTVIIDSGADTGFPSGNSPQESDLVDYMSSSDKWEQINTTNESDLKPGDVLVSADTSGQGRNHIFINLGDGKAAGANYQSWYGRIGNLATEWELGSNGTPFYLSGNQYKVFRLSAGTSTSTSTGGTSNVSFGTGGSNLSETRLEEFAQNDIMFYDPSDNCANSNGATFCTAPSGSDMTWIGDSYSILAKDLIDTTFPGVDYGGPIKDANGLGDGDTYIASGKCVDQEGIDDNVSSNPSGLSILEKIKNEGKLRPYLVFALGDNKGWTQAMMDKFLGLIDENTKVVLVTSETYNSKHDISDESLNGVEGGNYDSSNAILKKAAEEHSNIYLADWSAVYKDEFYPASSNSNDDGGHPSKGEGFKTWIQLIKDTIPKNCTAGLLPGNTIAEKIWNYFVQANIEGVSDNAAAIAGILGNMYTESGLNPFMNGESGEYYRGLYMLNSDNGSELWNAIASAVGKSYWEFYGWWCEVGEYPDGSSCADNVLTQKNVPQDAIDTALKMELDFMVLGEINGQRASDQTFHNEFEDFVDHFNVISDKNSARSYAELFLILVEIAYETGAVSGEAPQDAGVRAFGISQGHERWQGAKSRGDYAEEFYNRYANLGTPTAVSSSSSGGTVSGVSSGGYHQYDDLTDDQLWDLAEAAMGENSDNMTAFKNELSIMANLAEANGSQPPSGDNLWNYVGNGGWFTGGTAGRINGSHDINVDSKYLDAARDVLMRGNRTLPTQILEHDCIKCGAGVDHAYNDESHSVDIIDDYGQWKSGVTVLVQDSGGLNGSWIFYGWMGGEPGVGDPMGYFADNPPSSTVSSKQESGVCEGNAQVNGNGGAQIADAAVKMSWPVQAGQGDDSHTGQCKNSGGSWENYSTEGYPPSCAANMRDLYKQQLDTWLPGDDGMDCGKFVTTVLRYTKTVDTTDNSSLESYFETDDMWEKLSDPSTDKLKPGDVYFQPGHVAIYVGDYGGTYGNIASASLGERVGQVTPYYNEGTTTSAWRYKGGVGDGLTQEQAEKLASNYNNNVGNWDGKVAAEGNYCQSSSCASRYSNCTLFSAFFAEMFANVSQQGWPDGVDVVDTLKELGFETGRTPRPFAVFSTTSYHTPSGNHTGVVVGVDGDKIATVEAGYPSLPATYYDYTDVSGEDIWYAYLDSKLDYNKLLEYINK